MRRSGFVLAVVISFLLASGISAFADEIKVGGGGAAMNTVFKPIQIEFEKTTGIYLVNLQSTPAHGLVELVEGKVDAATAAVPLEAMVSGAEKEGAKVDVSALQQTVVGTNKTVMFVHKDNPVAKLSKEQAKGIFTGKITNWKQVGGSDKDIIVVWGKKTPGQNALFVKQILDGEPVMKDVLEATDYASIHEVIKANPDAIGIDPKAFAETTIKAIEPTPELSTPIIMVTKGKPSPNVQKLIDFIKGDGQKYVKR